MENYWGNYTVVSEECASVEQPDPGQLWPRGGDRRGHEEGAGHIIQDEGTSQTARSKLNFVGAGVTVTDDSGDDATVVTITDTPTVTACQRDITQTAHGLALGDIAKFDTAFTKAKADAAANADVIGIVSAVADSDNFTLVSDGFVTDLSGLTEGLYFLDPTTAGAMTQTAPTSPGQVSKPVFFSVSTTSGYILNQRGIVIPTPADIHETLTIPVSDNTTELVTGASDMAFPMPFNFTLQSIKANVTGASSSGAVTIDVKKNGTTILSTKITIDASEKTSLAAATAAVISVTSFSIDDELTFSIDAAGTGAFGATVTLQGVRA
jgi:hypothetical protein